MRAWVNLRYTVHERAKMFASGLKKNGYKVEFGLPTKAFGEKDILVTWNRIGVANKAAEMFIRRRQAVIVAENASWGNSFAGDQWYTLARNYHNTSGMFPIGDNSRWNALNIELSPFRTGGGESVILAQRGIGSDPVRMPNGWPEAAQAKYGGRIRRHPGKNKAIPLDEDLQNCERVITWGSGSAIKALMMGVPVISDMPNWIGFQMNTEQSRLEMFRRLAWGQARHSEIESGSAFDRLIKYF